MGLDFAEDESSEVQSLLEEVVMKVEYGGLLYDAHQWDGHSFDAGTNDRGVRRFMADSVLSVDPTNGALTLRDGAVLKVGDWLLINAVVGHSVVSAEEFDEMLAITC